MPPKGLNNLSIDIDPDDEEIPGAVRRSQSVCSPTRAAFALKTSMQRRRSSLTLAVSRPLMSIRNSILPTSTTESHAPIGFDEYTTVAEETEDDDEESTPTSKTNIESGQFGSPRSIGAPCNCSCELTDLKEAYVMPEEPSYHKLFHGCVICGSRPAERLCMWCWKGYCTNHCKTHWTETSETHRVFVDSEMSSYESIFWCCKCKSFTVSEDFDEILEKLCEKGTYVDVPITDKHTNGYQSPTIRVVATTMQCWRSNNEDTYIVVPNLKQDPHITFFGVFDGHGGPLTARFVADHLPAILLKEPALNVGDYETALKSSFLNVDEELKRQSDREEVGTCGTTATVVLLTEGQIFCACAGDSRAVLCRRGRSLDLSVDHNPSNPNERERILAAGSSIQGEDRVDGLLGVSRAVGDFDFKQAGTLPPELQAVTAYPEVTITPFTSEDQFIIVASDGLWNCLTSDEVVEYVLKQLKEHNDPKKAVESMLDSCVAAPVPEGGTDGGAGTDNITAILIVNDTASL